MDDQAAHPHQPGVEETPDMTPVPFDEEDRTPAEATGSEVAEIGEDEVLPELPERTSPDTEEADVRDLPIGEIAEIANIRPAYYGVEELAESFRIQGQLEPCLVRPSPPGATHGKPWELVFGFRRKRAAETLGWDLLRCQVRPISDSEVLEVMLTENLQREDLSAIAAAKTMRALIDLGGLTQADVARRLGVHRSHVSHSLKLLTLAPPVIERIDKGELTASHGETLAALPEAQQEAFADKVVKEAVSVAKLSSWVRQAKEEEALPPPELPGALEPVTPDDVTDLPRLYLREELDEIEQRRAVCYALLRNGNDQEILDWLEEREGVPYERLWSWLRDLDEQEIAELERRLVRRYLESAHRFPSFEPELVADLGDEDALQGHRDGVLTPALEPTSTPELALPAAPTRPAAEAEGPHWADELDEPEAEDHDPAPEAQEPVTVLDEARDEDLGVIAEVRVPGPSDGSGNEDPAPETEEDREPRASESDEPATSGEPPADQPVAPLEGVNPEVLEVMVSAVSDDALESLLAEAFMRWQGLGSDAAALMAARLALADDDILDAVLGWASDGLLPDAPVIEGATPASLGRRLPDASSVFGAMMDLREDPARARAALVATLRGDSAPAVNEPEPAERLAAAFIERQQLETDRAAALSAKIMEADEGIREAALQWASTGLMPETPVIEDESPASLALRLPKPSLVFTALMALRTNPAEARLRIPPR